ncbi:uncharacterized protein [Asterias amurensis]|uniref:uncharacterized protein isoform X4 n=1 Tax=Asterias amurensis TaxID=7602 RepID=UPI003AB4C581
MDVTRKFPVRTFSRVGLAFVLLCSIISLCNACQPTDVEITEARFYRASNVIIAGVSSSTPGENELRMRVGRVLKGDVDETEINITGFGTVEPCFWETTDLLESNDYILFLGERREDGLYSIVANPVESTDKERKVIRKFVKEGAAPSFAKELKDKRVEEGGRVTLSCGASGYPTPRLTMTKDDVIISKGLIKGINYKSGKGGIRLKFKRVQKSLHEGVYGCIADDGVHPALIMSARIEICALSCDNGELNVKRCECSCETGWDGLSCNIPLLVITPGQPCNKDCGEHGRMDQDECSCVCDENYTGDTCEILCDKTCDPDHGTLDPVRCTCQCESGYYGETCSSELALSSGDGGGITAGTADEMCNEGTYCSNGGTCYEVDEPKTRELILLCGCPNGFSGERCERRDCAIDCGENGAVDSSECRCVCDEGYRGANCESLMDDHTEPCGPKYEHYCMNGGECQLLKGIMKPSCRCPILYHGKRCERLEPDLDCGCLNGGECNYNETKQEYVCNCPQNFGGSRCQYVKPGYSGNQQENSRKMVITMCVIFVSMLIVIGIVIIVYVKNRNVRETERREKLEDMLREQTNATRLRASIQSGGGGGGGGGAYPTNDIELRSFHTQQSAVNMEPTLGARKASNTSVGRGSLSRGSNGSVSGGPRQSPSTSIHSRRSPTQGSPPITKGSKNGYAAVPTEEFVTQEQPQNNSDASFEGRGDPDTLPIDHQGASSDLGSESEGSDSGGDIIDVPNPQIQAIHDHLGGSDHDSGDYTWDEHSSPGLRVSTSPYTHDMSPSHQPRGRGRLNGVTTGRSPDHVNIHENPLESPGYKTDAMNNVTTTSPKADHYADRLKDVVESSPPSAV